MKKIRPETLSQIIAIIALAVGTLFLSACPLSFGGSTTQNQNSDNPSDRQSKGWRLWVKTKSCPGRFDWLAVAKEAPPPQGGGLSEYVPYETVIGRAPVGVKDCLDSNPSLGCTFAEAEKLREALRFHKKFLDYCCREHSVWKDTATGKMYVALVKTGTTGGGQEFVKGDLCCEEAEELAGTPGVCSGRKASSGVSGWSATQEAAINQGDGKTLTFHRGTTPEQCQADCDKNPQCVAFTLIKAGAYSPSDPPMCYLMSEAKKLTPSSCCITAVKNSGGRDGNGNGGNGGGRDFPNTPTPYPSTPTPTPSVARNPTVENLEDGSCNESERALWTKISGTWKASYGNVTFSGSCENITGSWMQGTWGHPLRNDGTDQRGEITGGRVNGGSITFEFYQSWGDQRKGSDSCSLSSDGRSLSCSYLRSLTR
ncbi:MAG: PAN domain-containing protein [Acidobacteriota bacterium]